MNSSTNCLRPSRWIRMILLGTLTLVAWATNQSGLAQIQSTWTRNLNGNFADLTVDGSGNVGLAVTSQGDIVTSKFNPNGSLLWSNRYDRGQVEEARAVVGNAAGQIWVTGLSSTNGGPATLVTLKYSAAGSLEWGHRFHSNVVSTAIGLDDSGNSYAGGVLINPTNAWSFYLIKYAPGDEILWTRQYVPPANFYVDFSGLTVDSAGNAIVVGVAYGPEYASPMLMLLKFDPAGNLLWTNQELSILRGYRPSFTTDAQGNTVISGKSLVAARIGGGGGLEWSKARTETRPGFDFVKTQLDPAGNIVIAGTDAFFYKLCADCGDSGYDYYLTLVRYSPTGSVLWPERSHRDYGFGHLQFDPDASCYLGGSYSSYNDDEPMHDGMVLAKYAPNGAELWRTNFPTGRLAAMKVADGGNLYLVTWANFNTELRKFVQPTTAPRMVTSPQNRTILEGGSASFAVGATGFPSPVYQWRFNGVGLSGETNETLTIRDATASHAGGYTVVLANSVGSITSSVATLTVNREAPTVTAYLVQPADPILAGATVTLCSQVTGGPRPALQWHFNGLEIPDATNACLTLPSVRPDQNGLYEIVARNSEGSASASVNLPVVPVAIVFLGPSQPVAVGQCGQFFGVTFLQAPLEWQWQLNGIPLPGETNAMLGRCPIGTSDAGLYTVTLRNTSEFYSSPPVALSVYYAPPNSARPSVLLGHTAALVGEDLTLQASYGGSPSVVQWRFNGIPLPGETNATLSLLALTPGQSGDYSFVASNGGGSTTSSIATVTVNFQEPIFEYHPPSLSLVEGMTARFTASARGGPPPVYFLERDGVNIAVPLTYEPGPGFTLLDTTLADAGLYRIIASNSLGVATSAAVLAVTHAGPLDRWTQRNPLPQSQVLLGLTHGANRFVAVGERGTIMASADGADWTVQTRRTDLPLQSVAHGNGLFVAIGEGGTILSSADGTNWAYRYTALGLDLNGVTYGAGRFVAVGTAPGIVTFVLHSADGIHWERVSLNGFAAQLCAAYGNGRFIIAGTSSIVSSTDGAIWSLAQGVSHQIESVLWADGRFVAVGNDGAILVSPDGATWTERPAVTTRRLLGVAFGAGRYVAAGARGTLLTSVDATTWAPVASGTPDRLESIDFAEGAFVAVGENGTIITSPDGAIWTKRNFGVTRDFDGMSVANGTVVVVGKGGSIVTSDDGVHYTVQNAGVTNDLHGVAWGDGAWVVVGEHGAILTSPNAINWTQRESGVVSSLKSVMYADGQWIIVGTHGSILRSPDAVNWSTTITSPPYDLNQAAFGNGVFLIAGDGPFSANGSLFKSSDGTTWTQVPFNPSKNLRGITFAQGLFLIAANDGYVFTTRDGSVVTNAASGISDGINRFWAENLRAAHWVRGQWVVVGNDGTLVTSPNAVTWTIRASRTVENLHQIALLNDRLIAIGNRGTILQSGHLRTELQPPVPTDVGTVGVPIIGFPGQAYRLEASTNLTNWTLVHSFTNSTERQIVEDPNAAQYPWRFYRVVEP